VFDAYVFVCGLIRQAKKKIALVDRYVDEKTLAMMLKRENGVSVTWPRSAFLYFIQGSYSAELEL